MSEFEKDLANVMGSFMEINLDCVEKQNQEIEQLQQERDKYKEVIEEAKEYVNNHIHQETFTGYMDSYELKKLLQILGKVKE